jgi:hypothetical protein
MCCALSAGAAHQRASQHRVPGWPLVGANEPEYHGSCFHVLRGILVMRRAAIVMHGIELIENK